MVQVGTLCLTKAPKFNSLFAFAHVSPSECCNYLSECRIKVYIVSQRLSQSQLEFVQLDDLRSHLCICAAHLINDHQIEGRHQLTVHFTKLYIWSNVWKSIMLVNSS